MKSFFLRLFVSIKRHPWRFAIAIFLSYSVIWTLLDSAISLNKDLKIEGTPYHVTVIFLSIVTGAIYRTFQHPQQIRFKIKGTETIVQVTFGDLFDFPGHKAIAVNEYFDSVVGEYISARSLHGQFILRFFGGHSEAFDTLVDQRLKATEYKTIKNKTGKTKYYPPGTTTVIPMNNEKFFLVVLSQTDPQTLKASTDIPRLWSALTGLWERIRIDADGHPVYIPLIGGGLSRTGLPTSHLLQFIILSIFVEARKQEIGAEIRIILTEDRFEEIDLELVRQKWG